VVTAGSQQALDLIGKVLLDPGDVAVVEHPAYVGALRAFAAYQPRVVGVPVDAAGLDTDRLAGMLRGGLRPKVCYVVPNFSNPSGVTMSAPRRAHLGELAARYGFLVVEDDPYGRLRFTGDDVAPVAAGSAQVAYLGSFSKLVAPGLRVGYAVVPPWLFRPLVVAKQAVDLNSGALGQRLVAELLAEPDWFARHVAGLRRLYAARADALTGALGRRLADRLRVDRPQGGMFVWASLLIPGLDALTLARTAMAHGVAVVPGDEFSVDGGFPTDLRLSFSMLDPPRLAAAVDRLAAAFDDHARQR
jgi:2-aminoadipate transaminase